MAVQFSTNDQRANVNAVIGLRTRDGYTFSASDVESELRGLARSHGVTVDSVTVELLPGERTVTMTESEYNALVQGTASAPADEGTDIGSL